MTTAVLATVPEVGGILATWTGLANGEAGDPAAVHCIRSVQAVGTFGVGGSATMEGSNDGATWATLTDGTLAAAVTFTAAGIKDVGIVTRFIRPRITAGDGTTALTILAFGV